MKYHRSNCNILFLLSIFFSGVDIYSIYSKIKNCQIKRDRARESVRDVVKADQNTNEMLAQVKEYICTLEYQVRTLTLVITVSCGLIMIKVIIWLMMMMLSLTANDNEFSWQRRWYCVAYPGSHKKNLEKQRKSNQMSQFLFCLSS